MNLSDITTKPWILALFKRDDGERFLLGDGYYDFKDSLQHFQPNSMSNDIVELQGTDGQLLAGQVRRSGTQSFDGYIGDGTTNRKIVEQRRKAFLMFFRKKHYYTVVYIFCDGTAIKRERGYLVDAPSVPEIRQKSPEYHVALNFENVNYYEYAENAQGDEIYSNVREIVVSNLISGGLVWDELGAVSDAIQWGAYTTESGSFITLNDAIQDAPMSLTQIKGNAEQITYSGKNLFNVNATPSSYTNTTTSVSGNTITVTSTSNAQTARVDLPFVYEANKQMTISFDAKFIQNDAGDSLISQVCLRTPGTSDTIGNTILTKTVGQTNHYTTTVGATTSNNNTRQLWLYLKATALSGVVKVEFSNIQIEYGASETSYEQYVGGTASPNPDYPQAIDVVTGEQTVGVTGKNLCYNVRISGSSIVLFDIPTYIVAGTYTLSTVLNVATSANTISLLADGNSIGNLGTISGDAGETVSRSFSITSEQVEQLKSASVASIRIYKSGAGFTVPAWGQVELGNQASSYEPYQGQSYEVNLGKNLMPITDGTATLNGLTATVEGGIITLDGTTTSAVNIKLTNGLVASATDDVAWRSENITENLNGKTISLTYISGTPPASSTAFRIYDTTTTIIKQWYPTSTNQNYTWTADTAKATRFLLFANSGLTFSNYKIKIQLEKGSSVSDFVPYFTPIELAKVGTYQDRIYKNDDKWYIEKQTQTLQMANNSDWGGGTLCTNYPSLAYFYSRQFDAVLPTITAVDSASISTFAKPSTAFYNASPATFFDGSAIFAWDVNTAGVNRLRIAVPATFVTGSTDAQRLASWKTQLDVNDFYIIAPLTTPTDTEITDETLLEQLEHIYQLYGGLNNISIVGEGNGSIEISYATELNPGGGLVWEDGGTGGLTTITIDAVDLTLPVWTITGPATNPTLSNITTGQTMSWLGTVPSGQTLIIDMNEQTATMAGANVYAFLSGNWVGLAPGTNRISYSVTGTDESSTLSWNNIVG